MDPPLDPTVVARFGRKDLLVQMKYTDETAENVTDYLGGSQKFKVKYGMPGNILVILKDKEALSGKEFKAQIESVIFSDTNSDEEFVPGLGTLRVQVDDIHNSSIITIQDDRGLCSQSVPLFPFLFLYSSSMPIRSLSLYLPDCLPVREYSCLHDLLSIIFLSVLFSCLSL